ncbi:glycoside hydrolase family 127 protein, partial [Streptomyces sp. UMAF16]|nr:glycoside hydrolase family 127 protein [Streptomyces sp. UMAF16]
PAASAAHPFSPFAVRLLPSPFSEAMDVDHRYLLSLDPLRLLHNVYQHSGLPTRGKPYGGWEQSGLASHSLG